jgi:ABC-type oligopeptide transport system substrate-binding subunit
MTWKTSSKIILMAAVAGLIMAGCKGKKADATTNGENILNARAMSDPDMLNPINLTSTDGRYTYDA